MDGVDEGAAPVAVVGPGDPAYDQVVHHIHYKRSMERSLPDEIADRMLAALRDGAVPDYQALRREASWEPIPEIVWHTAPATAREAILRTGLRISQPALGNYATALEEEHWRCSGQPTGVYVAPHPDIQGVWAHWPDWDIWGIDHSGYDLVRDELNPGCWVILHDIPPDRLHYDLRRGSSRS